MMSRKVMIAFLAAAILIVGALAIPRIYAAVTQQPEPILEEESCAIMPLDADPETYVPSCTGESHELDLEELMPTFNDPFGSN